MYNFSDPFNEKNLVLLIYESIFSCSKSGNHKDMSSVKNKKSELIFFEINSDTIILNPQKQSIHITNDLKIIQKGIIIPFRNENGIKIVRIKVNDVPLNFIFDTEASLISLSETEAKFLLKQGTLTEEDFLGMQSFVDANGDVSEGILVNIKEIEIQGYKLYNIRASIVQNSEAPLLLGQSFIEKFAKVTIDNTNQKIILKK